MRTESDEHGVSEISMHVVASRHSKELQTEGFLDGRGSYWDTSQKGPWPVGSGCISIMKVSGVYSEGAGEYYVRFLYFDFFQVNALSQSI